MHNRERGAATGRRSHTVARKNLHVLRDHLRVIQVWLGPRGTGDQAVDRLLGYPGVFERKPRGPHIKLGRAVLGHDPNLSIRDPDNRDPITENFRNIISYQWPQAFSL